MVAMSLSVKAVTGVTRADNSSKVISTLLLAGRRCTHIHTCRQRADVESKEFHIHNHMCVCVCVCVCVCLCTIHVSHPSTQAVAVMEEQCSLVANVNHCYSVEAVFSL